MNRIISVIIPIFNAEKYLRKCLDSVCNQTYPFLQIILIDDGSTDSSLSICREYCFKDERFELISQENKGVSAARNIGIDRAKGAFISFVDADDYLKPNTYEKAIEKIGDSDAIFFGFFEQYEEQQCSKKISPDCEGSVNSEEAIYQSL